MIEMKCYEILFESYWTKPIEVFVKNEDIESFKLSIKESNFKIISIRDAIVSGVILYKAFFHGYVKSREDINKLK